MAKSDDFRRIVDRAVELARRSGSGLGLGRVDQR
jgi:hypothetical protein